MLLDNQNIIATVDTIKSNALNLNASDIHFLPSTAKSVIIQFRIDGVIQNITNISSELYTKIQIHLKVLARLDISLTQVPQDGSFSLQHKGKIIACRINLCPTIFGQKIVLRLINNNISLDIKALGMQKSQLAELNHAINKNSGLVLVTGPTGSGKTVTLYSILKKLRDKNLSIMATCDPVEITLEGISQTNLCNWLTTPDIIKAFLRQDPDVIMIGEIRDHDSLKAALQAATTGHLVIASMHSNNAISTIRRIEHLGFAIEEFIDLLNIIVSQRLVRTVSNDNQHELKGVTGVYEVLPFNKQNIASIRQGTALINPTLQESATKLLELGITTQEEIKRTLGGNYY